MFHLNNYSNNIKYRFDIRYTNFVKNISNDQ